MIKSGEDLTDLLSSRLRQKPYQLEPNFESLKDEKHLDLLDAVRCDLEFADTFRASPKETGLRGIFSETDRQCASKRTGVSLSFCRHRERVGLWNRRDEDSKLLFACE